MPLLLADSVPEPRSALRSRKLARIVEHCAVYRDKESAIMRSLPGRRRALLPATPLDGRICCTCLFVVRIMDPYKKTQRLP